MNNMSTDLGGLLSIEPLPTPASHWEPTIFSAISLLALFVLILLIYIRYFSACGKLQQKLKYLQHKFESQEIDSHGAAFQLATIIQCRFHVHALSETMELPKRLMPHQQRWSIFIQHLSIARYSSNKYPALKMRALFAEAIFFL